MSDEEYAEYVREFERWWGQGTAPSKEEVEDATARPRSYSEPPQEPADPLDRLMRIASLFR